MLNSYKLKIIDMKKNYHNYNKSYIKDKTN